MLIEQMEAGRMDCNTCPDSSSRARQPGIVHQSHGRSATATGLPGLFGKVLLEPLHQCIHVGGNKVYLATDLFNFGRLQATKAKIVVDTTENTLKTS